MTKETKDWVRVPREPDFSTLLDLERTCILYRDKGVDLRKAWQRLIGIASATEHGPS